MFIFSVKSTVPDITCSKSQISRSIETEQPNKHTSIHTKLITLVFIMLGPLFGVRLGIRHLKATAFALYVKL